MKEDCIKLIQIVQIFAVIARDAVFVFTVLKLRGSQAQSKVGVRKVGIVKENPLHFVSG